MDTNSETPGITPEEATRQLTQDAFLLDVREEDEYARSFIPGATLIPLGELTAQAATLPADRRIIVYCQAGGRSARATDYLRAEGLDAVNLTGGILEWEKEGRPLERPS
jgi:rhodanese-related sulfurtransferase